MSNERTNSGGAVPAVMATVAIAGGVQAACRTSHPAPQTACELDGALATAPVRFPADAPEAAQLVKALALARGRLGADAARRAGERGAGRSLDALAGIALTAIDEAAGGPPYVEGTTTSGEVEPVEAP